MHPQQRTKREIPLHTSTHGVYTLQKTEGRGNRETMAAHTPRTSQEMMREREREEEGEERWRETVRGGRRS